MPVLTLDKIWINLVETGDAVAGYSTFGRQPTFTAAGETRTFAGGRRRSISQAGDVGTYAFTLRFLAQTQVDTLNSWKRRTVQVRDNFGRKYFGVFYEVAPKEIAKGLSASYDLDITLNIVSYVEGV